MADPALEAALLARASTAHGLELDDLRPLPGGISGLTYATADATGQQVVLKVAPPGLAPVRNRDVLRQARILRQLRGTPGVRVPLVLFEDPGDPPLFGMELVPGDAYEPLLGTSPDPPQAEAVAHRAHAAARMLAHLQKADPRGLGLQDEPVLTPRQEVERWAQLYETIPAELRGRDADLRDALLARTPTPTPARVTHGDYRLANLLCVGGEVTAIIDWELWSVGDPRFDLAWLLMHAEPAHAMVARRTPADEAAGAGMPSVGELLDSYLQVRPAPPQDLVWFLAAAHYKIAATMAALVKRARRTGRPDRDLEASAATFPRTLARGLQLLGAA